MKKMALDYGDVRIGIALSDILGILATGLETYKRKNLEDDIEHIVQIINENKVDTLVMGLPLNMDGTEGNRVEVTKAFMEELQKFTDVNVIYQDERLSSVEAENILIEQKVGWKKRKLIIDKLAATIILQSYLDEK
jgi:putative Holliday junction resolvase